MFLDRYQVMCYVSLHQINSTILSRFTPITISSAYGQSPAAGFQSKEKPLFTSARNHRKAAAATHLCSNHGKDYTLQTQQLIDKQEISTMALYNFEWHFDLNRFVTHIELFYCNI